VSCSLFYVLNSHIKYIENFQEFNEIVRLLFPDIYQDIVATFS